MPIRFTQQHVLDCSLVTVGNFNIEIEDMKIALMGFGKMGKTIAVLAVAKGHEIVYKSTANSQEGVLEDADVIIEFSTPESAKENILKGLKLGIPVVSGTTGWLDDYQEVVEYCKTCNGSFVYASNFSIGVNLFSLIVDQASALLSKWEAYDVEIEEIHHTEKKDAPSGTAISLAEVILKNSSKKMWKLEESGKDVLKISAKREADVKGTHRIDFVSEIDTISLQHEAHSRDGFAKGAIFAAEWLFDKKGIYTMKDVLGI